MTSLLWQRADIFKETEDKIAEIDAASVSKQEQTNQLARSLALRADEFKSRVARLESALALKRIVDSS